MFFSSSKRFVLIFSVLALTACSDDKPLPVAAAPQQTTATDTPTDTLIQRSRDFAQITRGARLFTQYCAQCHGAQAQGTSNWRQRGNDGKFPPPPLNGSAHAWHHPLAALRHTIKNGGPTMPAWKDTLTDQQIDDIIAWFQSRWPDDIYQTWAEMDQRARAETANQ